jgi:hypothetical protein
METTTYAKQVVPIPKIGYTKKTTKASEEIRTPLKAQPWGLKEFSVRDPFGNLIVFAERFPEA